MRRIELRGEERLLRPHAHARARIPREFDQTLREIPVQTTVHHRRVRGRWRVRFRQRRRRRLRRFSLALLPAHPNRRGARGRRVRAESTRGEHGWRASLFFVRRRAGTPRGGVLGRPGGGGVFVAVLVVVLGGAPSPFVRERLRHLLQGGLSHGRAPSEVSRAAEGLASRRRRSLPRVSSRPRRGGLEKNGVRPRDASQRRRRLGANERRRVRDRRHDRHRHRALGGETFVGVESGEVSAGVVFVSVAVHGGVAKFGVWDAGERAERKDGGGANVRGWMREEGRDGLGGARGERLRLQLRVVLPEFAHAQAEPADEERGAAGAGGGGEVVQADVE